MLSAKKCTLINSLLKRIASNSNDSVVGPNDGHHSGPNKSTSQLSSRTTALVNRIFCCCSANDVPTPHHHHHHRTRLQKQSKLLFQSVSKCDLEYLITLLESNGSHVGRCIVASRTPVETKKRKSNRRRRLFEDHHPQSPIVDLEDDTMASHILACFLLRWPHQSMQEALHLRPLPWCHEHSADHRNFERVCINPYHWSLQMPSHHDNVATPSVGLPSHQYYPLPSSTPPPSYSEVFHQKDAKKPPKPRWCFLAYWEYHDRIGRFHSVTDNSVNVHVQPTVDEDVDSLSLPSLFTTRRGKVPEQVCKTRAKIGLGVSLFRDDKSNVWLYNRSTAAIFVNSHTIKPPETLTPATIRSAAMTVVRVQPGHLIKAYDHHIAQRIKSIWNTIIHEQQTSSLLQSSTEMIFDFDSFRFSFVKGFGNNYVNRDIMQCPCWLEVILAN